MVSVYNENLRESDVSGLIIYVGRSVASEGEPALPRATTRPEHKRCRLDEFACI